MGSDFNIMKFSEYGNNLELNSLSGFFKSIISMIILAPYRLIHELSLKVIFVKKDLIEKSFTAATLVGVIFICFDLFSSLFISYQGSFFTDDLIIYGIGTIILAVVSVLYKNTNFMIYEQLDRMFPSVGEQRVSWQDRNDSSDSTENSATSPAFSEKSDWKGKSNSELNSLTHIADSGGSNTDISNALQQYANDSVDYVAESECTDTEEIEGTKVATADILDVAKSEAILNFTERYKNKTELLQTNNRAYCGVLSETEIEEFSGKMKKSTDPSKYISEELIKMFDETAKNEDLSFLADLDLSIIPESFSF